MAFLAPTTESTATNATAFSATTIVKLVTRVGERERTQVISIQLSGCHEFKRLSKRIRVEPSSRASSVTVVVFVIVEQRFGIEMERRASFSITLTIIPRTQKNHHRYQPDYRRSLCRLT